MVNDFLFENRKKTTGDREMAVFSAITSLDKDLRQVELALPNSVVPILANEISL